MKKLIAIGEALIDFAPEQTGRLIKEVEQFSPHVGGAPANVCAAYTKLGGEAVMLTQLGSDPFGDKIIDELNRQGIDTTHIARTTKANTSLAFVALQENGDREFSFYRKPGADMLYESSQVPKAVFDNASFLHFCSVSIGDFPMKEAHKTAIAYAKEAGAVISFDPNLRKQLWDDEEHLREAVHEFLPFADIVKISDDEVHFITGKETIEEALPALFAMGISVVLLTKGADGAAVYTEHAQASVPGTGKKAVDTTGAGDGFIGSFLGQLALEEKTLADLQKMSEEEWVRILHFSNTFCGISIGKQGVMDSYPDRENVLQMLS